jgi:hypothetical protein
LLGKFPGVLSLCKMDNCVFVYIVMNHPGRSP